MNAHLYLLSYYYCILCICVAATSNSWDEWWNRAAAAIRQKRLEKARAFDDVDSKSDGEFPLQRGGSKRCCVGSDVSISSIYHAVR